MLSNSLKILWQVIGRIHQSINHIDLCSEKQSKPNLAPIESQGYNWLLKKTSNMDIVVCEADKGGAKLSVSPELIDKKIKEKVNNPDLYMECEIDPRQSLHDELLNTWMIGINGEVITYLYRKDTDSQSYLHFSSCHPNHTFSSIVYSQGLHIWCIVGDNYRLANHLDKLKQSFFKANYHQKIVNNILDKVKSMPHILQRKIQPAHNDNNDNRIRIISTYGCDKVLVDIVDNTSKMLKSSKMFCKSNLANPYKFTKRVRPSLKSLLCNSNRVCVGPKFGITSPCGRARCQSCKLMSNKRFIILNGQTRELYFQYCPLCRSLCTQFL